MSTIPRSSRVRATVLAVTVGAAMITSAGATAASGLDATEPPGDPAVEALADDVDEGSIRVIVQVDHTWSGAGVAARAEHAGGENAEHLDHLPYVIVDADADTIRSLATDPHVLAVSEDVAEPPALSATLPVINADDTQALGWTGAGTTVAILDTGIDADHPFFVDNDNDQGGGSRIVAQSCFSDPNNSAGDGQSSLCPNGNQTDTSADVESAAGCAADVSNCDHGTHVAGIAAGDATGLAGAPGNGVAPDANIIAIQVFTRHTQAGDCSPNPAPCVLTYQSDQIAALNQVLALATANPGWNVTAVNMSLGGGNNATACDGDPRKPAIDALLAAGIATTISSGNSSFLNAVGAPGCISTAVTVGNTTNADAVWTSSNRGPLLDLFAPGRSVSSAIVDDVYGTKTGTSMSAPHVAGAFAVLREAYPTRTIGNLLADMTSTGVPITYATNAAGTTTATTPRLDLLAALQNANQPPSVTADSDPVNVDEGDLATNTGTYSDPDGDPVTLEASVGTVVDNNDGTWSWSLQTDDGPDIETVTITATDDKDESTSTSFDLVVANVAPTVAISSLTTDVDEHGVVTVAATFSDPGYADTYTASIDWGTSDGVETAGPTLVVTTEGGPGVPDSGTVTGSYQYGDDGVFTVTVTVIDDDGGAGSDDDPTSIDNVDPTALIDTSGATLLAGQPTIIAAVGETVDVQADSDDPGSDDLVMEWDWDDGSTTTTTSLVNPPTPDPDPSPTVQPRDETDMQSHVFGDACLYEVVFTSTDDDAGSAADSIAVIITGNADQARTIGYWSAEYRQKRRSDFDLATLGCMLDIVDHASIVFSELRALATFDDAVDVLRTNGTSDADELFDAQLLGAWLNFANGAYRWDELVDTDGDGIADSMYGAVVVAAETLRTTPHTRSEILDAKDLLETLNSAD